MCGTFFHMTIVSRMLNTVWHLRSASASETIEEARWISQRMSKHYSKLHLKWNSLQLISSTAPLIYNIYAAFAFWTICSTCSVQCEQRDWQGSVCLNSIHTHSQLVQVHSMINRSLLFTKQGMMNCPVWPVTLGMVGISHGQCNHEWCHWPSSRHPASTPGAACGFANPSSQQVRTLLQDWCASCHGLLL